MLLRCAREVTRANLIVSIVAGLSIFSLLAGGAMLLRLGQRQSEKFSDDARTEAVLLQQQIERGVMRGEPCSETAGKPDPWGNSYSVTCDGVTARVVSRGPDGASGTLDDIVVE